MKTHEVLPVAISIGVIILVAVLEKQSKTVAAITATMPLGIPLALWIVYSSSNGEKIAVEEFTQSMVIGIVPTMIFAIAIWMGARNGLKLLPILVLGYIAWAESLLLLMGVRRLIGW